MPSQRGCDCEREFVGKLLTGMIRHSIMGSPFSPMRFAVGACCTALFAAVFLCSVEAVAQSARDASVTHSESLPEEETRNVSDDAEGLGALALTAATIWFVLIAFVTLQFRRQRQLARELERLERLLEEIKEHHEPERAPSGSAEGSNSTDSS